MAAKGSGRGARRRVEEGGAAVGREKDRLGVDVKEANANCVIGHRRQFLAELVVATIVADGAEGNTCCSVSHCAVRLSDPSQLA